MASVADKSPLVVIVPGRLEARTGGYEYDRRIVGGLREAGWSVEARELDGSFPRPTGAALDAAARVLERVPDGMTVLIDGLALAAMPDAIECASARLRIVALVHLPIAAEIGLDAETAAAFRCSERRALAASSLVVVTGRSSIPAIEAYGIRRERIALVEPGTAPAPLARGSQGGRLQLLCVATLNPGKGHAILFRALRSIVDQDWRLTCAGSLERDPATVRQLRDQLRSDGLDGHVALAGELDQAPLDAWYDRADLFVLATLGESYGMAVAEALARGLPIVSTRTGAIPDLAGDEAGRLVAAGDEQAFAAALREVVADPQLRTRLAEGARRRRDRLPSWETAVKNMAALLTSLSRDGRAAR
jgi:glycosyltransferase involved in cell wall biosynthesis